MGTRERAGEGGKEMCFGGEGLEEEDRGGGSGGRGVFSLCFCLFYLPLMQQHTRLEICQILAQSLCSPRRRDTSLVMIK
jgi:hypothetical protein